MKRKFLIVAMGLSGVILMMSFTIQHQHFHSGLYGVLGSFLLVGAYLIAHLEEWQQGEQRVRHVTLTLALLCLVLVILNLFEQLL